jgi:hypothetical protein
LGGAFPIDGGTISPSSKRQDTAFSPTTWSGRFAGMHGGKEALWPCAPDSNTFHNLKVRAAAPRHFGFRHIFCLSDDMGADGLAKAPPSAKIKHFAAGG